MIKNNIRRISVIVVIMMAFAMMPVLSCTTSSAYAATTSHYVFKVQGDINYGISYSVKSVRRHFNGSWHKVYRLKAGRFAIAHVQATDGEVSIASSIKERIKIGKRWRTVSFPVKSIDAAHYGGRVYISDESASKIELVNGGDALYITPTSQYYCRYGDIHWLSGAWRESFLGEPVLFYWVRQYVLGDESAAAHMNTMEADAAYAAKAMYSWLSANGYTTDQAHYAFGVAITTSSIATVNAKAQTGLEAAYNALCLDMTQCAGDTSVAELMFDIEGMPNFERFGTDHVWNVVNVDGTWYNFDVALDAFLESDSTIESQYPPNHINGDENVWYPSEVDYPDGTWTPFTTPGWEIASDGAIVQSY
jgi:hypothetical protein